MTRMLRISTLAVAATMVIGAGAVGAITHSATAGNAGSAVGATTANSVPHAQPASPASARAGGVNRAIDGRATHVQLNGVINLHVTHGATASLTLFGDPDDVARVTVAGRGDTLSIDTSSRGWTFRKSSQNALHAELVLPSLTELGSHGVGSTVVEGYTAEQLTVTLDGAGAMTVTGQYRAVNATLGGVGNLTLHAAGAERIDVNLHGAGHVAVDGSSGLLKANLSGVGNLDAEKLHADNVQLDMSGLGGATVYADTTANLNLSGLGSATVFGKPGSRNVNTSGLGHVTWR